MPNRHKAGNEQWNVWLDAKTSRWVRAVMKREGLNRSDAIRLIIQSARARLLRTSKTAPTNRHVMPKDRT